MATSSRLPKHTRRQQLLDTALSIVRARGTDDLTLLTLAEAAGVSRPIVYDHFGTRSGLLLALYSQLEERHRNSTEQALRDAAPVAAEIAQVMSAAYFNCATDMPEFPAISAALRGDPHLEKLQRDMLDSYTNLMISALRPHSSLRPKALRLRCLGILGAAEAIAAELHRERTTMPDAITALTALILATLGTERSR